MTGKHHTAFDRGANEALGRALLGLLLRSHGLRQRLGLDAQQLQALRDQGVV